jgi:hypothetical protein
LHDGRRRLPGISRRDYDPSSHPFVTARPLDQYARRRARFVAHADALSVIIFCGDPMKTFDRAVLTRSRGPIDYLEDVVHAGIMIVMAVMPVVSLVALFAGNDHFAFF